METSSENQQATNPLTFLALGDSYTIGEAVQESERWPVVLAERLRNRGKAIAPPQLIAKTGWTTDELQQAIDEATLSAPYELVSLLIGVNNQYRGIERGYDTATYRKEFRSLLSQAIAFAGERPERVFVISIPDYGATPFVKEEDKQEVGKEIDLYNEINKEESQKKGVLYIDITPISKKALQEPSLVATDDLHPSGKMYALWVDKMENQVFKMIE